MIEIIHITRIKEDIFDVVIAEKDKKQTFRVTRAYTTLKDSDELMPFLQCDDREFSEIYLEIRAQLWQMIKEAETRQTLSIKELQTV